MAAFTSKADGNWSSAGQTTWTQTGVPATGDTVTIGSGHDITVDGNTTVGHSPGAGDATAAVRVNSTGTLTVAAGITFTVKGDLVLSDTTLTMAAGSVLEFDASGAGVPSTALYVLQVGTASASPNAKFICNGTSGSRVTVRSNASGGNARVTNGGFVQAGQVEATYTDFTRIGDSANSSFTAHCQGDEGTFHLTHCVLDACGTITTAVLNDFGEFVLDGVTMKNSTTSPCVATGSGNALSVGRGLRTITGCVLDKNLEIFPPKDFTITDTLVMDRFICTNEVWASVTGNLFRTDTAAGTIDIPMGFDTCYVLADTAEANPHIVGVNQNRDYVLDGCIFEYTGVHGDGDTVQALAPSSAHTLTLTHCLMLPNSAGQCTGTLVSCLGNANFTLIMEHNTGLVGSAGMLAVGETYDGHTGMVSSFKSNLCWDTSARGFKIFDQIPTDETVSDLIAAADADYNGGYNLLAGTNGKGYDKLEFSSGSPGAHDVDGVDPQFVDATRNLATWDASLGGAGTVANALAELGKRNDAAGYNANYTIAALMTWVKAGFAPQNPAYQAAHDSVSPSNGWIGAVEGVTAPAGGVTHYVMMTA